jgi:hypothetical protein
MKQIEYTAAAISAKRSFATSVAIIFVGGVLCLPQIPPAHATLNAERCTLHPGECPQPRLKSKTSKPSNGDHSARPTSRAVYPKPQPLIKNKKGTWMCYDHNGQPHLGIYGMITLPQMVPSTCRKIGN